MTDNKKTEKSNTVTAIILAAGKGTRMNSPLPKVLHPVCGKPMLVKVIESCRAAGIDEIRVVVGHNSPLVKSVIEPFGVKLLTQLQQLGTADAVRAAQPDTISGDVIILNGDHPLIEKEDLQGFIRQFRESGAELSVVTCKLKDPGKFGRIIRHQGQLRAIVEANDASADSLKINEVNTGIYLAQAIVLQEYLPRINNHNAKKEFYLTDLVSLSVDDQCKVLPILSNPRVAFGVNTQAELSKANRCLFQRKAKKLLDAGVLMIDHLKVYIEDEVEVAPGSVLYPQVYLRGKTKIGAYTAIEPNCYIVDSTIGESVIIKANSYIEKTLIKNKANIGPFARLRPETEIGEEASVGNFVEMKKVKFGNKSKAGHLTYLGDAEVGEDTNIGCGTITCNYAVDRKKYKTKIGSNVFVGSDSQFIAPITVGDNAVIGSGSTITKDVPENALAVARGKQFVKENYVKKEKS
jgi:bifunctional UDP-N-acetylglucosamine pyrophosphorylase / glucosamine-1-phosphate N-acetyltransferase